MAQVKPRQSVQRHPPSAYETSSVQRPGGGERGQERISLNFENDALVSFEGDFEPGEDAAWYSISQDSNEPSSSGSFSLPAFFAKNSVSRREKPKTGSIVV